MTAGPELCAVRQLGGYQFTLRAGDIVRLRELPGARGRSDADLAEEFLAGQAPRWEASLGDVLPPPAEVRVVVDPYSRQSFLASGNTVYSILSF